MLRLDFEVNFRKTQSIFLKIVYGTFRVYIHPIPDFVQDTLKKYL